MSSIKITPEQLGAEIAEQVGLYKKSVELAIDKAGAKAMKQLVSRTKQTAPINARHHGRHYVDCITSSREKGRTGTAVYTWYVKAPCYRLTHLLVNGHATKDGGHTRSDPFLKNAVDEVIPEFEQDVEKAVQDGN